VSTFSFVLDSNTVVDQINDDLPAGRISSPEAEALEEWMEGDDVEVHQKVSQALQLACNEDDEFFDTVDTVVDKAIRIIIKEAL